MDTKSKTKKKNAGKKPKGRKSKKSKKPKEEDPDEKAKEEAKKDDGNAKKQKTSENPANPSGEKATFARRARPKTAGSGKRWDSLKMIFNTRLAHLFTHPSSMEVWGDDKNKGDSRLEFNFL